MGTHHVYLQFIIYALSEAEMVELFLKMGYNIPTWYKYNIRRTADLEFKKPALHEMEYHVRANRLKNDFVVDCHYEPSQSANPIKHFIMHMEGMIEHKDKADYRKGKAQLRSDLEGINGLSKGKYVVWKEV